MLETLAIIVMVIFIIVGFLFWAITSFSWFTGLITAMVLVGIDWLLGTGFVPWPAVSVLDQGLTPTSTAMEATMTSGILDLLSSDLVLGIAGIIVFASLVFFSETERLWSAILLTLGAFLVFNVLSKGSAVDWIMTHWVQFGLYVVAYLFLGTVYTAYWKWRNYCIENARPQQLADYMSRFTGEGHDRAKLEEDFYNDPRSFSLHPKNHYDRLVNWMLFWVFSAFWSLLHDPLTYLGKSLYRMMSGVFMSIARSASVRPTK